MQPGGEVGEEYEPSGNRERNQIGIIAAVREDGVPAPDGDCASHNHREHDKKIFVGNRGGESVEFGLAAQPLVQSADAKL